MRTQKAPRDHQSAVVRREQDDSVGGWRRWALLAGPTVVACATLALLWGGGSVNRASFASKPTRLPLDAQLAVSRGLGAEDRSYWVRHGPADWTASSPRQRLAERFGRAGVVVASGSEWVGVQTQAVGRPGRLTTVTPDAPAASRNRVSYRRRALTEWYSNGPLGLEQGFTLARRPAGSGPISLALTLTGSLRPRLTGVDGTVALISRSGTAALRYGGLSVTDARGRPLRSWLGLNGGTLTLSVDDRGAAYPVRIDPTFQTAKLTASDGASSDDLGASAAVSGDTIVVGAPRATINANTTQGAVYVFVKPAAGWATATETAKLTASDGGTGDFFGERGVAVSGDTIVVGDARKFVSATNQGEVYVFVKPALGWTSGTETAKLTASDGAQGDGLGVSVSTTGDTVVAGAPNKQIGANSQQGAVYVFVKPAAGWATGTETAKLTASDGAASDRFGESTSISGDTAVVGAQQATVSGHSQQGAAYVFVKPAAGWATGTETAKLTASDGAANDNLGISAAISGDTAVVGAQQATVSGHSQQGAAYVFVKPAAGWATGTETAKLTASDGAAFDRLGQSVAIDVDTVVAGAPDATVGANSLQGAAYEFVKPGGGWATGTETSKLVASDGGAGDDLGFSVGVSGTTIVAGAFGASASTGAAYVFATASPPPSRTLTVTRAGAGSGSVSGDRSPAISCPPTCSQQYADGTVVTLTETPSAGSTFAGWSGGGCAGAALTCQVTLTADTTVTATFNATPPPPQQTLTVNMAGTRTGYVTGTNNFLCFKTAPTPGSCHQNYAFGTIVTLHPTPTAGSVFTGWSGVCGGFGDCQLLAVGNPQVTANFNPQPVLTVNMTGQANGEVFDNFGHTCYLSAAGTGSKTCSFAYSAAGPVTLHTAGFSGSSFSGWSGPCSGTGDCQITMTGNRSVTAAFAYDAGVHVNAIEVTQGVQTPELPTRDPNFPARTHVSYDGVKLPWQSQSDPPVTVKLAQDHATVVRVYVNTQSPLNGLPIPTITLSAYRNGQRLAPGPIAPDQRAPASAIPVGRLGSNDYMNYTQRYQPRGAYTFTLPWGWAQGDVQFVADANPPGSGFPLCSSSCQARGLILDGTHFNRVTSAQLDPLEFVPSTTPVEPAGAPGPDPSWAQAQAVVPFPIYVPPYREWLSDEGAITAISLTLTGCDPVLLLACSNTTYSYTDSNWSTAVAAYLLSEVEYWADHNDTLSSHLPYGVFPARPAGVGGPWNTRGISFIGDPVYSRPLYSDGQPRAVAPEDRPYDGLAHELTHAIGRPHADLTCGGNSPAGFGEGWLPNNDGAFDGVGIDTSAASPYRILHGTSAAPVYDIMSYCGSPATRWISVRNWNRDVEFRAPGPTSARDFRSTSHFTTNPPATLAGTKTLSINAATEIGGTTTFIGGIAPDTGAPTPVRPNESYSLRARGADGRIVGVAGTVTSIVHVDGAAPLIEIVGKVPAAGVREVDILQDGKPIAEDHASLHAPTARLLSPSAGSRVGGRRSVTIRWRAHDADGGQLRVTIDYSSNGGHKWHTIFSGGNTGTARVPSRLLAASASARVRLYVSDGFNEAIVTSHRFVARGAPPLVTILSPRTKQRIGAGAALDLSGSAYDDSGTRLRDHRLRWHAGGRLIGTGERLTTAALPPGRYRIVLTAKDHRGRTGTASVQVTILTEPPALRILRFPKHVTRRARSVLLRIASLAPARLTIGHVHVLIGRSPRSVRVRIRPGRKPLILTLVLRSGSYRTQVRLPITRG